MASRAAKAELRASEARQGRVRHTQAMLRELLRAERRLSRLLVAGSSVVALTEARVAVIEAGNAAAKALAG